MVAVAVGWYCFNAKVDFEIAATFSVLSSLSIVFIIAVLCIYSRCKEIKWITKRSSRVIFFYAALLSLLTTLLYRDEFKYINFAFIIFMLATSSVIIIWGSVRFFRQCTTEAERDSIVREESNLSTFIVVITVILTLLEVLIIIGSALDQNVWNCLLFGGGTVQKTIQVFVYHCRLRGLMAREDHLSGASWYYITIALVNLVLWNESIEITNDEQTKYMKNVLQGGYNIFAKAYTALIVDYRLICCILFVEHASEIEKVNSEIHQKMMKRRAVKEQDLLNDDTSKDDGSNIEQDVDTNELIVSLDEDLDSNHNRDTSERKNSDSKFIILHRSFAEYESFKSGARMYSGVGFTFGLLIIFLQILNGMIYSGNHMVGSWTNVMGCIAMWSFVLFGCIFLRKVLIFILWSHFISFKSDTKTLAPIKCSCKLCQER